MDNTTNNSEKGIDVAPKKVRGVIFIIVSSFILIVLPIITVVSMAVLTLLQPEFYAGILKNGRLITALVESKTWQTDQAISDEIERTLDLTRFTDEFEKIRARYERTKAAYQKTSREDEAETLKKQRRDVKGIDWKQFKNMFPGEEQFEKHRAAELKKIDVQLEEIEKYQDSNSDAIKAAKKEMKKGQSEYEDALSTLEDKKKDANKIVEKHKNTLASTIYDDLEIIEKPLSKILNSKLIDGAVRREIEKLIRFFTSYDAQVERRNIYYEQAGSLRRRTLAVKLPEIEVSLWVDAGGSGKKHVLSQLLADEVDKLDNLKNKTLLSTLFRLSDSSLAEHFGGKYLSKLGLSIEGGVIRLPPVTLKGEIAEHTARAMQVLSVGQYLYFAAAVILVLYIVYLVFSTVERRRKLAALKRLLLYPSLVVLAVCALLLVASQTVFNYYPELIRDLTVRSYAKHLSFITAWHLSVPLIIVFGPAFIAGLVLRKILARRSEKKEG